jgi:hypothetical protein
MLPPINCAITAVRELKFASSLPGMRRAVTGATLGSRRRVRSRGRCEDGGERASCVRRLGFGSSGRRKYPRGSRPRRRRGLDESRSALSRATRMGRLGRRHPLATHQGRAAAFPSCDRQCRRIFEANCSPSCNRPSEKGRKAGVSFVLDRIGLSIGNDVVIDDVSLSLEEGSTKVARRAG